MVELALKIVPCLGLAWLLGFAVAWLLRGVTVAELNRRAEQLETDLGTREVDLGVARRDLGAAQMRLTALEGDLANAQHHGATLANSLECLKTDLAAESDVARPLRSRINELEAQLERCGGARESLVNELAALRPAQDEPVQRSPHPHAEPAPGAADDLKWIHGVGPVLEKMLHRLGVYEFRQVAQWTDTDIDFFDAQLEKFRGRIRRENWVRSAIEAHYRKHGEWLGSGAPTIAMRDTDRG